jgi:hypothetical protein
MTDISHILALIKIIGFGITILIALIYSLIILLIRRFHNRLNILTVNICVAIISASIFWMGYFIMWEYYIQDLFTEKTCSFLFYLQSISTCLPPLAFVTLTINRLCSIIYSRKAFFKTKKFVVICIATQWIVACILSLPFVFDIGPVKNFFHYKFFLFLFGLFLVLSSSTMAGNIYTNHRHNSSNIDHSHFKPLYIQTCSFFITSNSSTKWCKLIDRSHRSTASKN